MLSRPFSLLRSFSIASLYLPMNEPERQNGAALTTREQEVLQWVSEGKSNWETAQIIGCSENTVKKHLQRAYKKIGVENRMSAANWLRQVSNALHCSALMPFLFGLDDLFDLADALGLGEVLKS